MGGDLATVAELFDSLLDPLYTLLCSIHLLASQGRSIVDDAMKFDIPRLNRSEKSHFKSTEMTLSAVFFAITSERKLLVASYPAWLQERSI